MSASVNIRDLHKRYGDLEVLKGINLEIPSGQTVAVMTAMGESSLINVDHGDAAGPDSRGLFQQRDNGAWGTYADRMNPQTAATNFYTALLRVEGWETLPPTIAAHRVQRNADPNHYAPCHARRDRWHPS